MEDDKSDSIEVASNGGNFKYDSSTLNARRYSGKISYGQNPSTRIRNRSEEVIGMAGGTTGGAVVCN